MRDGHQPQGGTEDSALNPQSTATVRLFHEHLDLCQQCRDYPFDLCAAGKVCLELAAKSRGPVDERCLQHYHHWNDEDLYFEDDFGANQPHPNQLEAHCTRCGVTMRESCQCLLAEIRQLMTGRIN